MAPKVVFTEDHEFLYFPGVLFPSFLNFISFCPSCRSILPVFHYYLLASEQQERRLHHIEEPQVNGQNSTRRLFPYQPPYIDRVQFIEVVPWPSNMSGETPSPPTTTSLGTPQYTPSATPSITKYEDHDPDYPLPSIERNSIFDFG